MSFLKSEEMKTALVCSICLIYGFIIGLVPESFVTKLAIAGGMVAFYFVYCWLAKRTKDRTKPEGGDGDV